MRSAYAALRSAGRGLLILLPIIVVAAASIYGVLLYRAWVDAPLDSPEGLAAAASIAQLVGLATAVATGVIFYVQYLRLLRRPRIRMRLSIHELPRKTDEAGAAGKLVVRISLRNPGAATAWYRFSIDLSDTIAHGVVEHVGWDPEFVPHGALALTRDGHRLDAASTGRHAVYDREGEVVAAFTLTPAGLPAGGHPALSARVRIAAERMRPWNGDVSIPLN